MGDPRKIRRTFIRPGHPWQKERMEGEKIILKEYGLKNKTEVWKTTSQLRTIANQAKKLIAATKEQGQKEKTQLIQRLQRQGLVNQSAKIEDVLGITLKALLERRLQTMLVRKGLAKTMNQSRQFITHEHVQISGRTITRPSYLVKLEEEQKIAFGATAPIANPEHPARALEIKQSIKNVNRDTIKVKQ